MNKLLTLNFCLLSSIIILSSFEGSKANDSDGPVSKMMENLAENTASVSNELLTQLQDKNERTANTLMGNIELLITSALNQLAQPLENFQGNVSATKCHPLITLQQLNQQIESDLSKCTESMKQILNNFKQGANAFKVSIESSIEEIKDLPNKCKTADSGKGFSSIVNCYIGDMITFNQDVAGILHNARDALVQARQLGENALQEGRACANKVIVSTTDSINEAMANCQSIEQ